MNENRCGVTIEVQRFGRPNRDHLTVEFAIFVDECKDSRGEFSFDVQARHTVSGQAVTYRHGPVAWKPQTGHQLVHYESFALDANLDPYNVLIDESSVRSERAND